MAKQFSRRELIKKGALASALIGIPGMALTRSLHPAGTEFQISRRVKDAVRLNRNENPYGPSKSAREAIIESIAEGNRYPRAAIMDLKEVIAGKEGLTPDHILVTAGSTELLGLAGLAYGLKGGKLISSQPTFDFLLEYSTRVGAEWVKIPLTEDYQYNLDGMRKAADADTRLLFVCNPNNPTGIEIPHNDVRSFCEEMGKKHVIYLDEAYIELSSMGLKGSMADMVNEYPKLIIARTFSKIYGLAGLRIGYAIAHPDTIRYLMQYHIGRMVTPSVTSVRAAIASLKDKKFYHMSGKMIAEAREHVCRKFDHWGITYLPSVTNFVFFKTDKFESDVRESLEKKNVYIQNYMHIPGWARVSIGTKDEMDEFLSETKKLIA